MFENVASAAPQKHPLVWAGLKGILLGVGVFFGAFFLSLPITIPWSKHFWAGDGQAVLGGIGVSVLFAIASAISAAIYVLRRATQSKS